MKDGHILLVGAEKTVLQHRGRDTEVVDLGGGALLPGFIDAHSHFVGHGVPITGWANVAQPPIGTVTNIPELIAALDAHKKPRREGEWIVAYGYDREGLAEQREVTRDDLDRPFPHNPVVLIHQSSHGAVLNSKALEAVGISARTPTPPGGLIARKPGTNEPTGLIMETAFFEAVAEFPQPSAEQQLEATAPRAAPLRAQRLHDDSGRRDERGAARAAPARRGGVAPVPRRGVAARCAHVRGHRRPARDPIRRRLREPPEARRREEHRRRIAAGAHGIFYRADARAGPRRPAALARPADPLAGRPRCDLPASLRKWRAALHPRERRRRDRHGAGRTRRRGCAQGPETGRDPLAIRAPRAAELVRPDRGSAVVLREPRVLLGRRAREEPRLPERARVPLAAQLRCRRAACTSRCTATTR